MIHERKNFMDIGNKIFELRKKNNLSQEQLAEKMGVARQTISKWELGETSPDLKQAKELSKIFKVSLDELVNNDIKDIVIEKVSNTEKLSGMILKTIKISLFVIPIAFIVILLLLVLVNIGLKSKDTGREIEETIYCQIYGEEHTYSITYQELTGIPIAMGGDSYFDDILNLDQYNDAHQIFNVINDYVKKNGGNCEMIEEKELNDLVDMQIKEGTLTNEGATILIQEKEDYDISYGESFWLEKYNAKTNSFQKLDLSGENCGFNLPAYSVTPEKPLELKQNWSCMYGKLKKGEYRLVKDVFFESDIPVSPNEMYYIWVEFEIDS